MAAYNGSQVGTFAFTPDGGTAPTGWDADVMAVEQTITANTGEQRAINDEGTGRWTAGVSAQSVVTVRKTDVSSGPWKSLVDAVGKTGSLHISIAAPIAPFGGTSTSASSIIYNALLQSVADSVANDGAQHFVATFISADPGQQFLTSGIET